jgi:hypothetical protein
MNEQTSPSAQGSWGCDCVDCRRYRVWQTEGDGEWQPETDGWPAWKAWGDRGSSAQVGSTRAITSAARDFAGRS